MTPLKLMKLVYIAYGWHIAITENRLFSEPIQAWKHGPVIESIYHEFKHFKNSSIDCSSEDVDFDTWEKVIPRIPPNDIDVVFSLSKVWASYRRFRAWDLRNKTHETNSPWHRVYKEGQKSIELRDKDIKDHYRKKIAEYLDVAKDTVASKAKARA